jgi:hypothetical protein
MTTAVPVISPNTITTQNAIFFMAASPLAPKMKEAADRGGLRRLESCGSLQWTQNSIREPQPLGCHFAVNSSIIPIFYCRYQNQTMFGETHVILVYVSFLRIGMIRSGITSTVPVGAAGRRLSLCKMDHLIEPFVRPASSRQNVE